MSLTESLLLVVVCAVLAYFLSGSKSKLYFLYFLSFVPFVTLNADAGGLESAAGLSGGIVLMKMSVRLLTAAGFMAAFLAGRQSVSRLALPQYLPVVFFVAWAMLGLHRAQAPWVSFFRLGELFVFFLVGVTLFDRVSSGASIRSVIRWHCLALAPLCAVAGLFVWLNPDIAQHTGEDGAMRIGHQLMNANVLGFAAVVLCLWATFELKEGRERVRHVFFERYLPALCLIGGFIVIIYARSRTSSITFLMGQVLIWIVFTRNKRKYLSLIVSGVILAFLFAIASFDGFLEWFMRGDDVETLKSGTGRTDLWSMLLFEQAPKYPLLGSGYLMLSEHGRFEHHGAHWNNAHNTFVFALVSTGIPGMLAVISIVAWPAVRAYRMISRVPDSMRSSWVFLLVLMLVVTITSVTGFGVSGHPNVAMFFHYALFGYVVSARIPASSEPNPQLSTGAEFVSPEPSRA